MMKKKKILFFLTIDTATRIHFDQMSRRRRSFYIWSFFFTLTGFIWENLAYNNWFIFISLILALFCFFFSGWWKFTGFFWDFHRVCMWYPSAVVVISLMASMYVSSTVSKLAFIYSWLSSFVRGSIFISKFYSEFHR